MQVGEQPQSAPTTSLRVALIDDHPLLREGVKTLLGHEPDFEIVGEAADGLSAVAMARNLEPDVMVMDISLPNLGGADATRQIVATHPSVRVLALSAHEDTAFVRLLFDAGASGYALKRSASDELVRAIRTVAAGDKYLDPSLPEKLIGLGSVTEVRASTTELSARESEVIRLIAQGHTSKEMAQLLSLSPRTLETYRARAMAKLNFRTRADLIRYALRRGWLRDA